MLSFDDSRPCGALPETDWGTLSMSATMYPPHPRRDEPDEPIAYATLDEVAQMRAENEQLRKLVVQLSRLVAQRAIARK